MKRFLLIGLLTVGTLSIFLSCNRTGNRKTPWGDPPFSGVVSGSATGYYPDLRVTLTLENGIITGVDLDLSRETASFARGPGQEAPELIKTMNSTNVDTIAGASETSRGIREAGKEALLQIPGVVDVGY